MVQYVDFVDGEQKRFLIDCKSKLGLTWKKFESLLKVSRSMIFFYLNEECRISCESFNYLCKFFELKENDYKFSVIDIQNTEKEIKIPKLNNDLSEFLGILAGDGYVTDIGYEISVTGHLLLDRNFMTNRVFYLFKNLFNIEPKISYQENSIRCRTYSKKMVAFLINEYNLPIRKKKNKLKIPAQIKENNELLKCYLRGLFDTDGSFHRHRKNDAALEYISASPNFLNEVQNSLKKLGFNSSISGKNLYIYRKVDIAKFFKLIKPKNIKHRKKYEIYKKRGTVSTNAEMLKLFNMRL